MTTLPMFVGITAAAATFVSTPLVVRFAQSQKLYCLPGGRRIHERPVPRLGGIAVLVGASSGLVTALVIGLPAQARALPVGLGPMLAGLLFGGGIAFAAGLIDDLRGIRPRTKLLAQVAAALFAYYLGVRIQELSWAGTTISLSWLSLPVTLLWIVGVTNAYNLVDGIDGLATGMGIIAGAATVAAAAILGHGEVVLVAAAVLGALVGFLPHNFHPARIFLGDSGSLFIGFVLAVLSVQGAMKTSTAVLVSVPLFALTIPLLDMVVAIGRRWLRGIPISRPDTRHIHHRLLALGLSQRGVVLVLYIVAGVFAGVGIILGFARPMTVGLIAIVGGIGSVALLVLGMRRLGYDEFIQAWRAMAAEPRRLRRVVRDRILAADLAEAIRVAGSIKELQAVLAAAAPGFGLLRMEVCPEADLAVPVGVAGERAGSVCKLDCDLGAHQPGSSQLVLRMHFRTADAWRSVGAEGVVRILGPAVAVRLDDLGIRGFPRNSKRPHTRSGSELYARVLAARQSPRQKLIPDRANEMEVV